MSDLSDVVLLRHLCGADDPDERADLRARLDEDAALAARVAALAPQLAPPPPAPRWPLPPAGWGGLPLAGEARAMGGDQGHALLFEEPDAEERLVVVLWNRGQGWEVLTPTGPADALLRPGTLPQDRQGRRLIDVVLPAGPSRWAVALPTLAQGPDWQAAEPWARFRAALFAGAVPVQVVQLRSPVAL